MNYNKDLVVSLNKCDNKPFSFKNIAPIDSEGNFVEERENITSESNIDTLIYNHTNHNIHTLY
jgi:hypothetical protein